MLESLWKFPPKKLLKKSIPGEKSFNVNNILTLIFDIKGTLSTLINLLRHWCSPSAWRWILTKYHTLQQWLDALHINPNPHWASKGMCHKKADPSKHLAAPNAQKNCQMKDHGTYREITVLFLLFCTSSTFLFKKFDLKQSVTYLIECVLLIAIIKSSSLKKTFVIKANLTM